VVTNGSNSRKIAAPSRTSSNPHLIWRKNSWNNENKKRQKMENYGWFKIIFS
jgi:hypothetical protein